MAQADQGNHRGELGDFLRSRRDRLKPEDTGLPSFGERRRVPGLRREELARLAGVSVDYYVRFEQGRAVNVSDAVVDAVAAALRLDGDETGHLHRLVRAAAPASRTASAPPVQQVRPGMLGLLRSMPGTPAFIVGRRTDVLAWNPLFATLITDFSALPEQQRNKAWLVFLHEETRGRFVNWETKARDLVAYLRLDRGRHPDDPAFTRLVDELSLRSAEFRRLWALHEVRGKTHGGYHLRHPATGEFTLAYESLTLPGDPDQTLIMYTAEAGSPSEAALRILAAQTRDVDPVLAGARPAEVE
ncbi:helix-turn-helix transcriptional regulator [Streptomyces sp. ZAF1911]|uniref:helix-turn-helix transcriptional regulator n=1 Tax=unclassified Streptomyces TaxID=2593676 RepID=UPI00237B5607|nr:helix-turn-helix transcriptional regulator [Streptomyces sp. ZAF1911]MDD9382970.1 helix-turn-helix transcriptional regulator [Streptomyces sp. ZAF1911]